MTPFRKYTFASMMALGIAMPVAAQTPGAAGANKAAQGTQPEVTQEEQEGKADRVVVTGSRIVRDGYEAPTPTTTLADEDIKLTGLPTIADVANRLPQLQGSSTPATGNAGVSSGAGGQNILNLRGLGTQRTLVLLDGRRVVPTSALGYTDANNFPSQLIKRVDVITGGASAAYGSDAVSGVVNFVLDNSYEGFKGSINGGESSRHDGEEAGASLSYGGKFLDDRLHVLLSAQYQNVAGINGVDPSKRDWYRGERLIPNPAFVSLSATPNVPALISPLHVNRSNAAPGGLVTTGALRGLTFGAGGVPGQFQFGNPVVGSLMVGGQNEDPALEQALTTTVHATNVFGRASYDIDDQTNLFFQVNSGWSHTPGAGPLPRLGPVFTVRNDNPYLPASVKSQMATAGVTSLTLSTSMGDIGRLQQNNIRETGQYTFGGVGKVFGDWDWNAYYQYGRTDLKNQLANNLKIGTARDGPMFLAADAVAGPGGTVVCRSVATHPECVPINLLGLGVASPQAIAYVTGASQQNVKLEQQVSEISLNGEPFRTWAGPVSVAGGIGYRHESVATPYVDAISLAGASGGWAAGNYRPTTGSYEVKEAFGETVVPLADGQAWAKKLELNGAVRYTDYSTSGSVTTWKAGLNYVPFDDLRFRGTVSRDIRAPSLSELFAGGSTLTQTNIVDPLHGNLLINSFPNSVRGNPNLKPEEAKTFDIGAVYQPSWAPGFSTSVDYYETKIDDGIASVSVQKLLIDCASGAHPEYCAFITRGPGTIGGAAINDAVLGTISAPVNLSAFRAKAVDFEATYRANLSDWISGWNAGLEVRGLATYNISTKQDNGQGFFHELSGEMGDLGGGAGTVAKWRGNTQFTYSQGTVKVSATWRYLGKGVLSNSFYDTSTGPLTVDDNHVPAVSYWDLGVTYKLKTEGPGVEIFARVNNLFDKDPPPVPLLNANSIATNTSFYDPIGRYFRAGVRFEY